MKYQFFNIPTVFSNIVFFKDLQKLLDSKKEGVIFFSMGSNLKSSELSIELRTGLLKFFGTLKQTVLWKFEEDLAGKPDNVVISSWLPQASILGEFQDSMLYSEVFF